MSILVPIINNLAYCTRVSSTVAKVKMTDNTEFIKYMYCRCIAYKMHECFFIGIVAKRLKVLHLKTRQDYLRNYSERFGKKINLKEL